MVIHINTLENIIDSRAQVFYKKKIKKLLNINILIINFIIFSFIKIQIINFYLFFKFNVNRSDCIFPIKFLNKN